MFVSAGQVVIVGVGLIGGSIGLAVRSHDPSARVVGVGRDRNSLDRAWRRGAIHEGTTDLAEAVSGASVVVVCTPVSRVAQDIRQVADVAGVDALVTDAGSTKRQIVEAAERHPRAADVYVGAHPMAGSERSGVDHARGDLFVDRVCVLTPTPRTPPDRLEAARRFWGG